MLLVVGLAIQGAEATKSVHGTEGGEIGERGNARVTDACSRKKRHEAWGREMARREVELIVIARDEVDRWRTEVRPD